MPGDHKEFSHSQGAHSAQTNALNSKSQSLNDNAACVALSARFTQKAELGTEEADRIPTEDLRTAAFR